ncbi:pituitary tumor-transforming gene 1 protein-interacting protein isoform X1 [Hydra vulgaris]|uniref:Pituitary tumor-transforming gene 1 protein-interacting protein n=1 Tax=Hydra vulgaris TaxID=6087 RepID=T2MFK1_HYDVU|nr:pituitary tumor-transforming gene 1 protein-interacting protein [Hydra vulgaris]
MFLKLFVISSFVAYFTSAGSLCSQKSNTSCSDCVSDINCFWCTETKICGQRDGLKPTSMQCDGSWNSFNVCKINGTAIIIIFFASAGVFLLIVIGVVYCCCCRNCCRSRNLKQWAKEDARKQREKEERQARHSERESEMKAKHDQIRLKYGLKDKQTASYERFA